MRGDPRPSFTADPDSPADVALLLAETVSQQREWTVVYCDCYCSECPGVHTGHFLVLQVVAGLDVEVDLVSVGHV